MNRIQLRRSLWVTALVVGGAADYNSTVNYDGHPSVGLAVFQLACSNAIDTANVIYAKMREARLDRLGPAKEIIQVAPVIGSEFSYDLLRAVHRAPHVSTPR
jgi:predicted ATPase